MLKRTEEILKKEHEEFLICNMYEDGDDGSSVDENLSRSGGSVREDDKEEDPVESTKTGRDGGVMTTGKAKLNFVMCGNNTTLKTSVSKVFRGQSINKRINFTSEREEQCVCDERGEDTWTANQCNRASSSHSALRGGSDASDSQLCVSL
ncbi:hypothetical protein G5714_021354 [Onychostoma macrolepis]|uniref:Uncharacterized protein n=1 Tax=Onychostoma macrolepis TaxID=369639 RepID=A0A7J6BQY2_9TELE|nr:hypothetical protein G5714_021354 [Onychostoma macrolepis]